MNCRICGTNGAFPTYTVTEMMFGSRDQFDYFKCSSCGCLQIETYPENMTNYYPSDYYSKADSISLNSTSAITRFLQKQRCRYLLYGKGYKLNKILKHTTQIPTVVNRCAPILKRTGITDFNASFLDVGCGSQAWWLEGLWEMGFSKLFGIDPFINSDIFERSIRILKSDIMDVSDKFDVITFHHSFEHMQNPFAVLSKAKQLLQKSGTCVVRLPLVSSYAWDNYGVNWVELDAPRHFFLHTANSFTMLAERCGFQVKNIVYDSTILELVGSEQYVRGIPHTSNQSYFVNQEESKFTPEEISAYEKKIRLLNAEGRAGRAQFYLKLK